MDLRGHLTERMANASEEQASQATYKQKNKSLEEKQMGFFNSVIGVLQTLVIALGAGLGIWGAINLMEGYGNDNPGAKSQGMKQLMPSLMEGI